MNQAFWVAGSEICTGAQVCLQQIQVKHTLPAVQWLNFYLKLGWVWQWIFCWPVSLCTLGISAHDNIQDLCVLSATPQHTQPPAPRGTRLWQCWVRGWGILPSSGFLSGRKKTSLKNSASDQRVWRHRLEGYGNWNTLSGQLSARSTQSIYLLALCDPMSLCQDVLGGRNTLSKKHPEGFFAPV